MLRLFVGLEIPETIKSHLASFTQSIKTHPNLRWIPAISLHITLKFLGQVDSKNVSSIQSVLSRVAAERPQLKLALGKGGVFPSSGAPRVFWSAIEGDVRELTELATTLEQELAPLGYPPENRKFKPHLTVARSVGDKPLPAPVTGQFCTLFSGYASPTFQVNEVHLIQSHLNASGARYETLSRFPLRVP